jgi:predicted phage terminase large subunit-like protein
MRRWQKDPGPTEKEILATAEDDGIGVRVYMEQEPGASGKGVISHYRRNILHRFMFRGVRSTGSKEVRALVFSAAVSNKRFFVVNGPWTEDFIRECEMFPNAAWHDDQVDAVSGGMQKVKGKRRIQAVGRTLEEIEIQEQRQRFRPTLAIIA